MSRMIQTIEREERIEKIDAFIHQLQPIFAQRFPHSTVEIENVGVYNNDNMIVIAHNETGNFVEFQSCIPRWTFPGKFVINFNMFEPSNSGHTPIRSKVVSINNIEDDVPMLLNIIDVMLSTPSEYHPRPFVEDDDKIILINNGKSERILVMNNSIRTCTVEAIVGVTKNGHITTEIDHRVAGTEMWFKLSCAAGDNTFSLLYNKEGWMVYTDNRDGSSRVTHASFINGEEMKMSKYDQKIFDFAIGHFVKKMRNKLMNNT